MKTPSPDNLDTVPVNIIFFPSQLCWKVGVVRKSTARVPQPAVLDILQLPQRAAQSWEEVRGLFADTREILMRRSGTHAARVAPRRMTLSTPLCALSSVAKPSIRRPMNHSIARSQMTELFARKRDERPPENFLRDFIQEFHKRNDAPVPKPRRSASRSKNPPH